MNILVTYTDGHTNEHRAHDMVSADRMAREYAALATVAKVEAVYQGTVLETWV